MIKILCFMRRKAGLSMAEFKSYYEEHHVPLIERHMAFYTEYRRNFVEERQHETEHMVQDQAFALPFDVLTELTYADEAMYQKNLEALADPVIGALVRADEEQFLDRASMRVIIADERRSK